MEWSGIRMCNSMLYEQTTWVLVFSLWEPGSGECSAPLAGLGSFSADFYAPRVPPQVKSSDRGGLATKMLKGRGRDVARWRCDWRWCDEPNSRASRAGQWQPGDGLACDYSSDPPGRASFLNPPPECPSAATTPAPPPSARTITLSSFLAHSAQ